MVVNRARKRKNRKKFVCSSCGKEYLDFSANVQFAALCVVCCKKSGKIKFANQSEYRAAQLSQMADSPKCPECGEFDIVLLEGAQNITVNKPITRYKCNKCGFTYNPYMCGSGTVSLVKCEALLDTL